MITFQRNNIQVLRRSIQSERINIRKMSCLCGLFKLGKLIQDFGRVSCDMRFNVGKDPSQISLRVNDIGLSVREGAKTWHGQGAAVQAADGPAPVREHVKVQAFGTAELGILFGGIHRNTHNLRVECAILFHVTLKTLGLERAALRKSAGIKVEDRPDCVFDF